MATLMSRSMASLTSLASSHAPAKSATMQAVDPETEMAAWFMSGVPRAEVRQMALDMMKNGEPGNFLVRDVKSEPDCYGLSIKNSQDKLVNYLIERASNKSAAYRVRGTRETFDTISSLIAFYCSEKKPSLGIQLVLSDPTAFLADSSSDEDNAVDAAPGSELSSSDVDSDATVKADDLDQQPLTDEQRWALNAKREELRSQRASAKAPRKKKKKKKKHSHSHTKGHAVEHRSHSRKPRRSSGGEERLRREPSLEPAISGHVEQQLQQQMHQLQQVQMQHMQQLQQMQVHQQMQQAGQLSMMGSVIGVPAMTPPAQYTQGGATDLQIKAAEAHLAMMKAEAEVYQAQLKAAQASLTLYKQRDEDTTEAERYEKQAKEIAESQGEVPAVPDDELAEVRSTQTNTQTEQSTDGQPPKRVEDDIKAQAALTEQARQLEEEAAQLESAVENMRRGTANAQDKDRILSAAQKHAKSTSTSAQGTDMVPAPKPTRLPSKPNKGRHHKPAPEKAARGSEQFKVNEKLRQEQIDKLARLEAEESRRRKEFDKRMEKIMISAHGKSYAQRTEIEMKVDKLERAEMERRRDWERNREEREAHYLMYTPEVHVILEEYLAEQEEHDRQLIREKEEQEKQARSLVGMGRVRALADRFSQQNENSNKKSHVMTWKLKEADVRSAAAM